MSNVEILLANYSLPFSVGRQDGEFQQVIADVGASGGRVLVGYNSHTRQLTHEAAAGQREMMQSYRGEKGLRDIALYFSRTRFPDWSFRQRVLKAMLGSVVMLTMPSSDDTRLLEHVVDCQDQNTVSVMTQTFGDKLIMPKISSRVPIRLQLTKEVAGLIESNMIECGLNNPREVLNYFGVRALSYHSVSSRPVFVDDMGALRDGMVAMYAPVIDTIEITNPDRADLFFVRQPSATSSRLSGELIAGGMRVNRVVYAVVPGLKDHLLPGRAIRRVKAEIQGISTNGLAGLLR